MLSLEEIHTFYDLSHILQGVSLKIDQGEIVSLIGRNGAGKTTTLKSIMNIAEVRKGTIWYEGTNITNMHTHLVAQQGITLIPEDRRVFPNLTVSENLTLAMCRLPKARREKTVEEVLTYFPLLRERFVQMGRSLSGGEQQMLTIARGMATKPKLMLIDEPTEGLMPIVVDTLADIIQEINKGGMTILLVEQNLEIALKISHRGYVMDQGKIVFQGQAAEIRTNEEVQRRYLLV
jgi:branched-chain amino acid transport system ATP-binding protein